jgi:hypothetical protein
MRRPLRFSLVFALALVLVPFLPLYIERTMIRSWVIGRSGDLIEWGWEICSLRSYWSGYSYYRPEQRPALWLGVNLLLAAVYASTIAFGVDRVMSRRALSGARGPKRDLS